MEKVEIRAVIKYLSKNRMSHTEIHEDFIDTIRKESPSYSTLKTWAAEFKTGRAGIKDDERPGRQKEATNYESAEAVHDLVMCDRRQDLRSIAWEVSISFGSVQAILTDVYGISKVSARWVPRLTTRGLGLTFQDIYCPAMGMNLIVSQDETLVHHFDP
jgi:transposase